MPYIENSNYETPDDDTVIWHFMNFPEFCSILVHQKLFFTRSDCFDDPWEGAWPNYYHDRSFWKSHVSSDDQHIEKIINFFDQSQKQRKKFAVSCWHMNNSESEPFWKLYSNQEFGIALKSTIGKLKDGVSDSGWSVYIGAIDYVDFDSPQKTKFIDSRGLGVPILYKRDVFKHENEVRAFIKEQKEPNNPFKGDTGRTVTICPLALLDSIVISPMADDWFVRVVKGMIDQFGYNNINCYRSNLYDRKKN